MKKLVNIMCIICILFSMLVITVSAYAMHKKGVQIGDSTAISAGTEAYGEKQQGQLIIPIPEGLGEENISVDLKPEDKSIMVRLYGVDADFYYRHSLNGETKLVSKLLYDNTGDSTQLEIRLNEYCACDWQLTDEGICLGLVPIADAYSHIVLVDAGHMEEQLDYGTVMNGVKESDINFALAQSVKDKLLERGIGAILSRNQSEDIVAAADREAYVREYQPELVVSIHCAGDANTRITHGIEVSGDRELSGIINKSLLNGDFDSVELSKESNLSFDIKDIPLIKIKAGYLTNLSDAVKLSDEVYIDRMAETIAVGIADYLENK